ncbi:flagellar hook-associated protein FlgK [Glutamicibacter creatinolyticus]|uniref:flagellar hook-associated protein FlgK n=1 Tax=Glutamicibacter creatinolyticus TaxID=162496 RepID=UPI0033CC21AE
MSTFSGLNTAMSGLTAARLALETAGNNLANVGTHGYTRQRVELQAARAVSSTGMLSSPPRTGEGVIFTGIARLADAQLDARVRGTTALAAQSDTRAEAMGELETLLREPGENGLSALLDDFWGAWEDVANQPGEHPPAVVLIESAKTVTGRISQMAGEISEQWSAQHRDLQGMVADVNGAAESVAGLNAQIRSVIMAGGSPNALLDQRDLLTGSLAELTGATVRESPDGTVDVLLDGNPLVTGSTARILQVGGTTSLEGAEAPTVQWSHLTGQAVSLRGGRIAGALSILAPADSQGAGGPLAQAAASLNNIAAELAGQVNQVQHQGKTPTGAPGADFFGYDPASPARTLTVLVSEAGQLATAAADGGALDGSNAAKMAQLAHSPTGPTALWTKMVIRIGTDTKTEAQRAVATAIAADGAISAQRSASAVSIDEENVALVTNQHAFQAAARVMSAVDEMLDTLINRTGVVGR